MDDYSDISFQIPATSSSNLLLVDESVDFLGAVDVTLTTPAVPTQFRHDSTLTLAELTPRSKRPRTSQLPTRRSPRKHRGTPAISAPLKQVVKADVSTLTDEKHFSFRRQDQSFQIPSMVNATMDLLMEADGSEMFGKSGDASFGDGLSSVNIPEPLTQSQLTSPPRASGLSPPIRTPSPTRDHHSEVSDFAMIGNEAVGPDPLCSPYVSPLDVSTAEPEAQTSSGGGEGSSQPEVNTPGCPRPEAEVNEPSPDLPPPVDMIYSGTLLAGEPMPDIGDVTGPVESNSPPETETKLTDKHASKAWGKSVRSDLLLTVLFFLRTVPDLRLLIYPRNLVYRYQWRRRKTFEIKATDLCHCQSRRRKNTQMP
jgi:hypothetical protein